MWQTATGSDLSLPEWSVKSCHRIVPQWRVWACRCNPTEVNGGFSFLGSSHGPLRVGVDGRGLRWGLWGLSEACAVRRGAEPGTLSGRLGRSLAAGHRPEEP